MSALTPEAITLIMIGALIAVVLSGIHLGVATGGVALVMGLLVFGDATFQILYSRVYGLIQSYVLLAVPLFIFMGLMLEKSGVADGVYEALHLWLGRLPGGLAVATVLAGAIIATCVGIVAASVTILTLVATPSMLKRHYDKGLALGAACAGGSLGILIPPSTNLVIYGPMAGLPVGRLFMAAFIPGFVLAALYALYIVVRCRLQPAMGPALTPDEIDRVPLSGKLRILITQLAPVVVLILSILGTIFFGIATPTEAAGTGAFVAVLLALAHRRLSWTLLRSTARETVMLSGLIFFIATMSYAFTGVFMMAGCGDVVQGYIVGAPLGKWGAFALIMIALFLLGTFIMDIGIIFIMVPIMTPIGAALGFDPIWFAIMVNVNLQMSFMTPPFAPAIFFAKGVAKPEWGVTMSDIIRGVVPFIGLIVVGIVLCVVFPELVLWLPGQMKAGF